CFVKVYGAVFLGTPRSGHADGAHEAGSDMLAPMAILAGCCFVIGLAPQLAAPLLEQAGGAWLSTPAAKGTLLELAPLASVSIAAVSLLGALVFGGLLLRWLVSREKVVRAGTWDCGYAGSSPRI